jgi:soluble lytic murein transglycosylase-like protein
MRHASKNNLDPNLIAAVIWQESGGNPSAYSKSGAVGLMQVMPRDGIAASFQCINGPCFTNRPSISELEKPNFNIKYGTGMIAGLLQKYGSMREALKYYGPMNVGYYYADKVISIYQANNS